VFNRWDGDGDWIVEGQDRTDGGAVVSVQQIGWGR